MSEPTPLSAEQRERLESIHPMWSHQSGVRGHLPGEGCDVFPCLTNRALATIGAQATEIAILKDGRCVSCMEPCNPLHPKCACIRAEIAEMEAEIAALKGALEGIVAAIDAHHPKYKNGPYTFTQTEIDRLRRVLAGKEAQR